MTQQPTSDHDLIVRLDENVKNLVNEFQNFKSVTANLEPRLRIVEDSLTKLAPIPSVSHQSVVDDISHLAHRIDLLYESKDKIAGGWKAATVAIGILTSALSILYYLGRVGG